MVDTGDPFAAPAQGGTLKQIETRLLLVFAKEKTRKRSKFPTDDGSGFIDAVKCDIHVIDAPEGSYVLHGVTIMSGSMVGQILPYVGTTTPVLGRLGMETFERGKGWVLNEATEPEKETAREYFANLPKEEKKDPFAAAKSE